MLIPNLPPLVEMGVALVEVVVSLVVRLAKTRINLQNVSPGYFHLAGVSYSTSRWLRAPHRIQGTQHDLATTFFLNKLKIFCQNLQFFVDIIHFRLKRRNLGEFLSVGIFEKFPNKHSKIHQSVFAFNFNLPYRYFR